MKNLTSLEIRQEIHLLAEKGLKSQAIALELGISIWTVRKWRQRLKKGALSIQLWAVLPAGKFWKALTKTS